MAMKALDFYNLTQKYIHSDEHLKQDEETKRKELESFNNHFNNLFDQESADMDDEEFEAYKAQFKPYEANKQISPQGRSHEFARRIQEAKKSEAWENLPDNEKAKYNQVIGQKYRELRLAEGLPIEAVAYNAQEDAARQVANQYNENAKAAVEYLGELAGQHWHLDENQPKEVKDLTWGNAAKAAGKSVARIPGSAASTALGFLGGVTNIAGKATGSEFLQDLGTVMGTGANSLDAVNQGILPPEQKQIEGIKDIIPGMGDRTFGQKVLTGIDQLPEQIGTWIMPGIMAKTAKGAVTGAKALEQASKLPKLGKFAVGAEKSAQLANKLGLHKLNPEKVEKIVGYLGSSGLELSEMYKKAISDQGEVKDPTHMLLMAGIAGYLEDAVPSKLFRGSLKPATRAMLRRDFGKGAWKTSASFMKNLGKDTLNNLKSEGLTELLQTYLEQAAANRNAGGSRFLPIDDVQKIGTLLNKKGIDGVLEEAKHNERLAELVSATILGGLSGGLGNIGSNVANYISYNSSPEGYLERYRENRESLIDAVNNAKTDEERQARQQELETLKSNKRKWEESNPANALSGDLNTILGSFNEMSDPETSEDDLKDSFRNLADLNDDSISTFLDYLQKSGWQANDTFYKNLDRFIKYREDFNFKSLPQAEQNRILKEREEAERQAKLAELERVKAENEAKEKSERFNLGSKMANALLQRAVEMNWMEQDAINKFLRGEQLTSNEENIVNKVFEKYSGQTTDISQALNSELQSLKETEKNLWSQLNPESNTAQKNNQTETQNNNQIPQQPKPVKVTNNQSTVQQPQSERDIRVQQALNRLNQLEQEKIKDEQEKEQLRQQLTEQQKSGSNANVQGQPLQNGKRGFIGNEARLKAGDIDTKCNYAVVELSDLQTLSDEENPRQRNDRQAYANTVSERARNLDPDLLIDNSVGAQNGPIVVDSNFKVESGNGRTLSLREAYANRKGEGEYSNTIDNAGYGRADLYRNKLIAEAPKYGISSEQVMQMKEPVLVRIRVADSNINAKDFYAKANNSQQESMSSTETALVDGEKIKPLLKQFEAIGDIRAKSNLEFVRSFLEKICSPYELNSMFTSDGQNLSEAGEKRINNAIIAAAYGDSEIVSLLTELGNEDIQTILNGLAMAAPDTAKLMGEAQNGNVFDVDISKDLADAIKTIKNIRQNPNLKSLIKQFGSVSEVYLRQGTLGDDGLSPTARLLIGVLGNLSNKETIRDFLKEINKAVRAEGSPKQIGMFEANTKPSNESFVETAIRNMDLKYKDGSSIASDIERLEKGPASAASNDDFHAEDAQGNRYSESNDDNWTEAEKIADDGTTATKEEFDTFVENINKSIKPGTGISFVVMESVDEFNKDKADEDKAPENANALYEEGGRIILFRNRLKTLTRLKQVAAHELLGHAGIKRFLGSRYYRVFLSSIRKLAQRDRSVERLFNQVQNNYRGLYAKESIDMYEELGAHLAELYGRKPESFSDKVHQFFRNIRIMFRNALRNWGIDISLDHLDIEDIFARSRETVEMGYSDEPTYNRHIEERRYSRGRRKTDDKNQLRFFDYDIEDNQDYSKTDDYEGLLDDKTLNDFQELHNSDEAEYGDMTDEGKEFDYYYENEAEFPEDFYGKEGWKLIQDYQENGSVIYDILPRILEEDYEFVNDPFAEYTDEDIPAPVQALLNITDNGEFFADLEHELLGAIPNNAVDLLENLKDRIKETFHKSFANKIIRNCDKAIEMIRKGEFKEGVIKPISVEELERQDIKKMPKTGWEIMDEYDKANGIHRGVNVDILGSHIKYSLSSEAKQIKQKAIDNGTFLKAPNGKDSNLNENQWIEARTQKFKDSFGDWELANELYVEDKPLNDKETIKILEKLSKKELINDETGIKAIISRKQRDKLVSMAATRKSIANGFSINTHNRSVAIIDKLFKHASLLIEHNDRDEDPNIKSIKRFVSPVVIEGEPNIAYLTAKESIEHGHRIYSLELTDIKKLEGNLNELINKLRSASSFDTSSIKKKLDSVNIDRSKLDSNGEPLAKYITEYINNNKRSYSLGSDGQRLTNPESDNLEDLYNNLMNGSEENSQDNDFVKDINALGKSEDRRYALGGERAKTANIARLNEAKRMLADGEDKKTVWQKTGWYIAKDGKPRFEIKDKISFKRGYPYIVEQCLQYNYPTRLSWIINNKPLFKAYPFLEDYQIYFYNELDDAAGYFDPKNKGIHLNLKREKPNTANSKYDVKRTLIHELQHAIQNYEGFAKGSSVENEMDKLKKSNYDNSRLAEQNIKQTIEDLNNPTAERIAWDYVNLFREFRKAELDFINQGTEETFDKLTKLGLSRKELRDQFVDLNKSNEPLKIIEKNIVDADKKEIEERLLKKAHDNYYKHYGEGEARAVEDRLDYADFDRDEFMPEDDFDYNIDESIISGVEDDEYGYPSESNKTRRYSLTNSDESIRDFAQRQADKYNIRSLNDSVNVQKQVLNSLPDSFYKDVFVNSTGDTIRISKKGIKETFAFKNFSRLPRLLKACKLAVLDDLDKLLGSSERYVSDEKNYHAGNKETSFDYFRTPVEVDGKPCIVKFDIKKGKDGKRLYLYRIEIEKQAQLDLLPENGEAQKSSDLSNDNLQQIPETRKFSLSSPVEQTKNLIAVHNLSEQELLDSLKLGGFPMPSIAIVKDSMGHEKYGDISVVFNRDTIDPKKSKYNKVYGGDAYTPTFPKVGYKFNSEKIANINKRIEDILGDELSGVNGLGHSGIDDYNLNSYVQSYGEDLARAYHDNSSLKATFLKEKGIDFDVEYKDSDLNSYFSNDFIIKVLNRLGEGKVRNINLGTEEISDSIIDEIRDMANNEFKNSEDGRKARRILKDYIPYNKSNFGWSKVESIINAANRFLNFGIKKVISNTTKDNINKAVEAHETEYRQWLNNLFDGIIEKKGLRNSKDYYTPNGNPRNFESLYDDFTLNNIVKAMRKEKPKKSIFGSSTSDYSSIDNLKEDSERIKFIEDEEFSKLRSEIQDRFSEIEESLGKNYGASEMLIEAVSKYESKANIERYLARECDKLGIELRSDTVEKLISLRDDIRRLPTGYFEAKPQRAVGLDEVVSVIIPSHSTDRLRNALKEAGIETVEYEIDSDSSDRLKALNNIADNHNIRFSLSSNQKLDLNGEEYSVASIEDSVKGWFYDTFESDMDGLSDTPIDIKNLKVIGSRAKGNYNTDSDLDVILEYDDPTDSWREDDVFNMLNEVTHELNGVKVDINPIKKEDSGTIEEWLNRNYDYNKNTEDSGRRYSLNQFLDSGKRFVDVQANQEEFDGLSDKQKINKAIKIIKDKFAQKVIGIDNRVFVNSSQAKEYGYPPKEINDKDIINAKMRASTELDNLVDAGTNFRTEEDGKDGHIHPDAKNFEYFDVLFKVGDQFYKGVINIKNNNRGRLFYDITKIENVTKDQTDSTGNIPAFGFLRDISMSDEKSSDKFSIAENSDNRNPAENTDQTETQQFKRWFGKSIMTEDGRAGGKPKVFYHGTDQYGFDVFRDNSFFTDDEQFAKRYETQRHQDYKPGTYEVYLSIEKPFDIRNAKDRKIFTEYRNGHKPTQTDSGAMEWTDFDYDELTEYLKENYPNKYDGYVIQETYNNSLSYVPFEKSQIKSATDNIGTFDRNNDSIRYSLGSTIEQQRKQFEDYVDGKMGIKLSDDEKDTIKAILETDDDADLDLNDIPTFGERLGNAKESLKTFLGQLITGLIGDTQSRADRKKAPYLWAKDHSTENVVETPYEISRRTKIEQGMKTREEEDRLVLKHLDADKNLFTGLIRKWTKPGALQDWMLKKASRILAPFQIMKPVEQLLFTVAENIMWDEAKQQMVIAPYRDTEYDKQTNRPIGYKYDPNEKNGRLALDIYNNKLNDEFKAIIKERSIANNKFREDFVNRVVPFEQAKLYLARFGRKRLEGASKKIVDGNDQQAYSYITKLKGVIDDLDYNNLISQYDQIKSIPDEQLGRNSAFINSIIGELAGNPAITTNGIDAKLNWLTTNKGLYGYAHHLVSIDPETGNGKPFNALGKISHPWIESIAGDRRGRKGDNSEYRSLLRADLERNRKEAEAEAANRWMEATENTYGITLEEAKNLEKLQKQGKGPGMPEGYEHRHKVIANFGKFRGKVIYLPDETFEAYQMVRDNRSLDSMKQFKEFIQKMNNLNGRINEAMLWHPGKAMRDIMAGPFHLLEFLRDWSMKHPTEINDAAKAIWHGVKNSVSPEYWQSHSPESMGEYSESVIYQTQEGQSPTFGFIDSLFNYFQRAIPVGRTLEAMYKEINFAGGADIPLKRIFTTVGEELADKRGLTGQERERFIYDLVNDYAFDTGDLPEILGWLRGKKPDSKSQALGMISRATVPFMGYATRMIKQMITDPVTKGAIPLAKRAFGNVDSDSNLRSEISEISRPFFWLMLKALIAAGLGGILPPPTAEEIQDMPGVPPSARTHGRFYVGDSDKGERWMSTKGLGQLETAYIMDDYLKGKSDIIDFSSEFLTIHPVMKYIANLSGLYSEYDRKVPFTTQTGKMLAGLIFPELTTRFTEDINKLVRAYMQVGTADRRKQTFIQAFIEKLFGIPAGEVQFDKEGHLRLSDPAIETMKMFGINIREIPFDTIEETTRAEASRIANDSKKIEKLRNYRSGKYAAKSEQEFLKQDFGGDFSSVDEAEKHYSNIADRERKVVDTATKLHNKGHWTDLEEVARGKKELAAEKRKQYNEGKPTKRRRTTRRKKAERPLLNDDLNYINNDIRKSIYKNREEEYQDLYDKLMQNNKKHNPRRGVAGQLERLLKEME